MDQNTDKKQIGIVAVAKKKRQIHLYEKIQKGQSLSRSELKELERYEDGNHSPAVVESMEEVAKAFGLKTVRTVQRWKKDGMPCKGGDRYDIKEITAWKIGKEFQKTGNSDSDINGDGYWQNRYRKAKALNEELRYRENLGQLIPRADVEKLGVQKVIQIRRAFQALPRSLAPQLVGLEAREIEALLAEKTKEIIAGFTRDKVKIGSSHAKKSSS